MEETATVSATNRGTAIPLAPADQVGVQEDDDQARRVVSDSLVLMVDDEPINSEVVQLVLEEAGMKRFLTCSDSRGALDVLVAEQPDVVLLDLVMPHIDGFDLLSIMKKDPGLQQIPVIMLTSSAEPGTKLEALRLGATDFLAKPVDPSELVLRLQNVLSAKAYRDYLAQHSAMLEHQVQLRTAELEAAQHQILHCLATAGEFRDQETAMHVIRVGRYAGILARKLGASESWAQMIEQAAPLHDVGKIGIPDAVLLKPGKLTDSERSVMERHCTIGTEIICPRSLDELQARQGRVETPDSALMRMAAVIAETHHERWDGTGYPRGLKGREIPAEGRIVAVADVYDALRSTRPYKEAFPREKCYHILRESSGSHFDPAVVDAFFASLDEIMAVENDCADS